MTMHPELPVISEVMVDLQKGQKVRQAQQLSIIKWTWLFWDQA